MTTQTRAASAAELEAVFQQELATDRWAAAESAYALALVHREAGDWPASRQWAQQCLRLLEDYPSDTLEDVATRRTNVGGVQLPTYLHDGVIRARFGDVA